MQDYVTSSPAIGSDGTIYIGDSGDIDAEGKESLPNFYAINSDGTLKWTFRTGSWITSPAIDLNGTIYFSSSSYILNPESVDNYEEYGGGLHALNTAGIEEWIFCGEYTNGVYSNSVAIGSDGTIYNGGTNVIDSGENDVGQDIGILDAINPDGTLKWTFQMEGFPNSSPAISSDGTIFIGSSAIIEPGVIESTLYAINPDGTEKWSVKMEGDMQSSPAIGSNGTIYVGSGKKLYAINGESGGLANSSWPMFKANPIHIGRYDPDFVSDVYSNGSDDSGSGGGVGCIISTIME